MFETFAEVHTVAFPVGIFQQFTSILFQGVPERFPKLRLAFLEIGCTWLPYWLDRMNEHWELRGNVETPDLKRPPSEVVRDRPMYFSVEAGETLLPETLKYLGDDHFVYASDIPHWDNGFLRACIKSSPALISRKTKSVRFCMIMPKPCTLADRDPWSWRVWVARRRRLG